MAAPDASGGASGEASSKSAARKAALKALEATARAGGRVELLDSFATEVKESDLGSTLRVENDFVDGVMGGDGRDSDPNALSEEAIERAAAGLPIMTDPVDTATMHPSNLVGKYHAWRIKSSYPIPGHALVDDFRRRYLSMYATEQEKALQPQRLEREKLAEVRLAVLDRAEEARLPNGFEQLVGRVEAVLQAQGKEVRAHQATERARAYEASEDEQLVFRLLRERKVPELEQLFLRGEVNVGAIEPGSASTGLLRACSLGLLTVVKLYLKAGADPNYLLPTGLTPLHCAWDAWLKLLATHPAKRLRYLIARDTVQVLVEGGADPNFPSRSGITPLHMAAMFGHDDIVACLLRNGADRERRDIMGRSPRDLAATAGHRGAAGLLANWGHVQDAYRREEFRHEWDVVLDSAARRDRARLNGVGAKGVRGKGMALDDPRKAARAALHNEHEAFFTAAHSGASLPAEELVRNLALQERLRSWRVDVAQDEADAQRRAAGDDPALDAGGPPKALRLLSVAEYDLERDALREVDLLRDHEVAGDSEKVLRIRLAQAQSSGVSEVPRLPWARRREKATGGLDADHDAERNAAEEEVEADLITRDVRGAGELGNSDDEDDAEDDEGGDGVAAEAFVTGGANVVRQDSTRNLSLTVFDAAASSAKGFLRASASTTRTDPGSARNLLAASRQQARASGSTRNLYGRDPAEGGAQDGPAAASSLRPQPQPVSQPRDNAGAAAAASAAGSGTAAARAAARVAYKAQLALAAGKKASAFDVDAAEPAAPLGIGPPADVSDVGVALAAQIRKATRMQWRAATQQAALVRRNRIAASRSRSSVLDLNLATAEVEVAAARAAALAEGKSAAAAAEAGESARPRPVDLVAEEAVAAALVAARNKAAVEQAAADALAEPDPADRKQQLMNYYLGLGRKDKASTGHALAERRRDVATLVTGDVAERFGDNTHSYRAQGVHTRRPAAASAVLRPARMRVDTRQLVDADVVMGQGRTFELLMTGEGGAAAFESLKAASASHFGAGAGETGVRPSSHGATGPETVFGDGDPIESMRAMSNRALPTLAGARVSGSTLSQRPDGSVDSGLRARLVGTAMGGPTKGNDYTRHAAFGTAAQFVEPALLPANTTKRLLAERAHARKFGVDGIESASAARMGASAHRAAAAADEVAAVAAAEVAAGASGGSDAAAARANTLEKRRLLVEARAAAVAEAAQAQVLRDIEAQERRKADALARGEVIVEGRGPPPRIMDARQVAAPVGSYGVGLLASWPLHRPGYVQASHGSSLREHAVLDVLEASRREHEAEIARHADAYRAYEGARAARMTRARRADGGDVARSAADARNRALLEASGASMERASVAAAKAAAAAAAAAVQAKVVARRLGAVADKAVPLLSGSAAESERFVVRQPLPPPPAGIDLLERDLRGVRSSRFATFVDVDDPFRHARFVTEQPVDLREM